MRISAIISAYNEEGNIKEFLTDLISQKQDGFVLEKILVISDASTDGTVRKAKEVVDLRVKVVNSERRMGKSHHLNNFFRNEEADVYVFFDADVRLDNGQVLQNLIAPIMEDKSVGLVGGNAQVTPGKTFIENAINVSAKAFDPIRVLHHGGNNAFGANGCIMALSKAFAKTVHIPENMIANDQYLYFFATTNGFKFIHQRKAIAWYRSPSTAGDHIRQNSRFMASHKVMHSLFGEVAEKEYNVPKSLMYKLMLKEFAKAPLHGGVIFLLNRYCSYKAKRNFAHMGAKWPMATSTKQHIHPHA